METNIPIVVIGYNRPRSLTRLLQSLQKASYPNRPIDLIISIDCDEINGNEKILAIAEDFEWGFGDKKVLYQTKNLGLREHVLKCGDLTQEYDAIIVLEDDLYVAEKFYFFAYEALTFSLNDEKIGGISLYNHQLNVHNKECFLAREDGYDNWYFQFASSWGQAWTKKQWSDFKNWYAQNPILRESPEIPQNVQNWSNKSWLKFYIAYLIQKDKYFLYPKISMSTNFSDAGTHMGKDTTIYQVPLYFGTKESFNFSSVSNSESVYDAFFENQTLIKVLEYPEDSLCIDLYGYKENIDNRYWLTTRILGFEIIRSFSRSLKPIDANIYEKQDGMDIFLYDTTVPIPNSAKPNIHRKISYNLKYISFKDSYTIFLNHLKMKVTRLFR